MVNCAVTVARSASRRASRSPTFVFSALIWSNILGVVGMVAFSGFRSIAMNQPCWRLTPQCAICNPRMHRLSAFAPARLRWQAADGAWNALPGVERQRKVDDRGVLID